MAQPVYRLPCHRSMLAVDVEGSTRRTDPSKAHMRRSMYELLLQALYEGGLTDTFRDPFMDRGDGVMVLVHPVDQAPKTVLLDTVIPTLGALLAEHNARHSARRFRLRAVVHAGEVTFDDNGCFGEAVDVAFRLLEAEPAKRALSATEAPMVLVVSDDVHRAVVRHGYDGIDPSQFTRLVMPQGSELVRSGWIRVVEGSKAPSGRVGDPVTKLEDHRRRA
jgi:FAD/FMN-containing dehydrogenase